MIDSKSNRSSRPLSPSYSTNNLNEEPLFKKSNKPITSENLFAGLQAALNLRNRSASGESNKTEQRKQILTNILNGKNNDYE